MNKKLKTRIIYGLVTGLGFACIMAGFDYYDDKPFNVLKFIFYFISFGLLQTAFIRFRPEKPGKN